MPLPPGKKVSRVGRSCPPRGKLHGAKDRDGNDGGASDKRSVDREHG
jgi:hypothetical protein